MQFVSNLILLITSVKITTYLLITLYSKKKVININHTLTVIISEPPLAMLTGPGGPLSPLSPLRPAGPCGPDIPGIPDGPISPLSPGFPSLPGKPGVPSVP